jgi:hypothetical protein
MATPATAPLLVPPLLSLELVEVCVDMAAVVDMAVEPVGPGEAGALEVVPELDVGAAVNGTVGETIAAPAGVVTVAPVVSSIACCIDVGSPDAVPQKIEVPLYKNHELSERPFACDHVPDLISAIGDIPDTYRCNRSGASLTEKMVTDTGAASVATLIDSVAAVTSPTDMLYQIQSLFGMRRDSKQRRRCRPELRKGLE